MSNPARVGMSGPLSVFAAGFLEELVRRGCVTNGSAESSVTPGVYDAIKDLAVLTSLLPDFGVSWS